MGRRGHAVGLGAVALVVSSLGLAQDTGNAAAEDRPAAHTAAARATVPTGCQDVDAIGGLSEPVSVAFAPDGTAFIGLKTGAVKSFDYQASTGQFEPAATATDFADLTVPVNNYGDRGLTGIVVDPQFPARPYVYVNYTFNKDPGPTQGGAAVPRWGVAGVAYDECGSGDANEATLA